MVTIQFVGGSQDGKIIWVDNPKPQYKAWELLNPQEILLEQPVPDSTFVEFKTVYYRPVMVGYGKRFRWAKNDKGHILYYLTKSDG
jgi:hypothetical protein